MAEGNDNRKAVKARIQKYTTDWPNADSLDISILAITKEDLRVMRAQITGLLKEIDKAIDPKDVKENLEKAKILSYQYSLLLDRETEAATKISVVFQKDETYTQNLKQAINKLEGRQTMAQQQALFGVHEFPAPLTNFDATLVKALEPFDGKPEHFPDFWNGFK